MSEITLKKKSVDMTEGSIVKHILMFAIPLLVGNIFQQLYNMVDTWVVGNFVSNEAFSAPYSIGAQHYAAISALTHTKTTNA